MPPNPESAESDQAGTAPGQRELVLDGEVWLVYERPAEASDRNPAPSLVFECRSAIRRVRHYPTDWFMMSDAALRTLSWAR